MKCLPHYQLALGLDFNSEHVFNPLNMIGTLMCIKSTTILTFCIPCIDHVIIKIIFIEIIMYCTVPILIYSTAHYNITDILLPQL